MGGVAQPHTVCNASLLCLYGFTLYKNMYTTVCNLSLRRVRSFSFKLKLLELEII